MGDGGEAEPGRWRLSDGASPRAPQVTVGSALDIFGGELPYEQVVAWDRSQASTLASLREALPKRASLYVLATAAAVAMGAMLLARKR